MMGEMWRRSILTVGLCVRGTCLFKRIKSGGGGAVGGGGGRGGGVIYGT